jgi:hypothetical protein
MNIDTIFYIRVEAKNFRGVEWPIRENVKYVRPVKPNMPEKEAIFRLEGPRR